MLSERVDIKRNAVAMAVYNLLFFKVYAYLITWQLLNCDE